jgi:uncharacterized membrane protein
MTALPLAVDQYLVDWLDLLLRWLHVIAAMAWIGTSFYFVLLDQSLRRPKDPADAEAGVAGELWEVHGGGFYQVQKYTVAPHDLPDHVAWFKWEAYTTWLSGFGLMVVLYYLDASGTLVDPTVADLQDWQAIIISAGLLAVAWVAYDVLNRLLAGRPVALWSALGVLVAVAAWGAGELFAPRAAWLQVGAMIGTVMAANVFFVIIPAHRELIRAKEAGRDPDPRPLRQAKQRSVHNNYLTLPVLLTMLAGHFAFVVARDRAWLVLVTLMALGAWTRLFFNERHTGSTRWWMAAAGALAVVALAVVLRPGEPATPTPPAAADLVRGRDLFLSVGCGGCHTLTDAGTTGGVGPNLDAARPSASLVVERVTNGRGGMPAFQGQLDAGEIADVAAYVSSSAGG